MPLKNHQYHALMREYDRCQLENKHLHDTRLNEVYMEIPEMRDLDHAIATLSVKQAKKLLDGDESALDTLRLKLEKLSSQKHALLVENGFDFHYLEPVYNCAECKDTGYIGNQKCHCFIQASIDLLYTQSNIREILETENFSTFRMDYYSTTNKDPVTGLSSFESITKALEISKTFIRKFSLEYQNLLFYGNTGIGKTFLTNCIAKEVLEAAHSVLYFSAPQLFDTIAETTFSKKDVNDNAIQEDINNCDLLIIDDLGTELTNAFVSSQFFLCLNERHLRKKSTIISTNLSLKAIRDTYSERIFSRLSLNYTVIKLYGEDIRIQKKLQNRESCII